MLDSHCQSRLATLPVGPIHESHTRMRSHALVHRGIQLKISLHRGIQLTISRHKGIFLSCFFSTQGA